MSPVRGNVLGERSRDQRDRSPAACGFKFLEPVFEPLQVKPPVAPHSEGGNIVPLEEAGKQLKDGRAETRRLLLKSLLFPSCCIRLLSGRTSSVH